MKKEIVSWDVVVADYNKKNPFTVEKLSSSSAEIALLSTPELVREYINKYKLSSYSAEISLLSTPELVREYINKYKLSSSIAEISLLSTPELVREYINKYELSRESFYNIIKRWNK